MTRAHRRKAAPLARPPVVVPAPAAELSDKQERLRAHRMKLVEDCFEELVDLYEMLLPPAQRTTPKMRTSAAAEAALERSRS